MNARGGWLGERRLGAAVLAAAAALGAAAAPASAAVPTAVTGAVTAFGPTSATVTGTVDPNGQATTWHFEYGQTTAYGASTPAVSAGSGTASASVSATIEGLAPSTTYHYRFVAANASGTANGGDGVFTTAPAPPPEAVTAAASGLTPTSATLNGTVNANGRPTTWYFEYGTSTSYGSKTAFQNAGSGTSAVGVSAPVTGLSTGRTYHFRVVATNDAGTGRGADRTFTLEAPPAATTRAASSVSGTGARLNGTVDPNGRETSWHFEYGTSTAYGTSTPARSAGSGTSAVSVSASISGLASGTTYHVRLVATSAAGTSAGADRTFTTIGVPVVETGAARDVGTSGATVTGTVDPKTHTTSWWFEYGTTTGYGARTATQRISAGAGARGVSAALSGLAPGTTYHYRLVATSSAGTRRGADASLTTVANAVTLEARGFQVVYGRGVTLTGTTSTAQAGVGVAVLVQRWGDTSFATAATVLTGPGGRWTYVARPTIRTVYQASANGVTSAPVTVGVRPFVSLTVGRGGRVSTHVRAARSFAGRRVQLQRLARGRWRTVARARLGRTSSAVFAARALPRGRSTIRVAMSVNQAGAGYLAGFSRKVAYSRR